MSDIFYNISKVLASISKWFSDARVLGLHSIIIGVLCFTGYLSPDKLGISINQFRILCDLLMVSGALLIVFPRMNMRSFVICIIPQLAYFTFAINSQGVNGKAAEMIVVFSLLVRHTTKIFIVEVINDMSKWLNKETSKS